MTSGEEVENDSDYRQFGNSDDLSHLHFNFGGMVPYGVNDNFSVSLDEVLDHFRSSMLLYKQSKHLFVIVCYCLLFLLSILFNMLVLITVYQYPKLRSITNYLLVNLTIADLLVTLTCMPMAIATNIYRPWIYGDAMCKMVAYMEGVAVSASIFTLTTISIDRFMGIRYPLKFRKIISRSLIFKAIGVIWIVSICLFIPVLVVRTTEGIYLPLTGDTFLFCIEKWQHHSDRLLYSGTLFVVVYAIPGHIIILAYSMIGCSLGLNEGTTLESSSIHLHHPESVLRSRRRIARVMLVLALVFAICWLPYNIVMLMLESSQEKYRTLYNALPFILFLGHANSAANPILYCFLAKNFRTSVKDVLRRGLKKIKFIKDSPTEENEAVKMCPIHGSAKSSMLEESPSKMASFCTCQRSNNQISSVGTSGKEEKEARKTPV